MLLRVVVIFLLFMIAMAFVQRLLSGRKSGKTGPNGKAPLARIGLSCPGCGRLRISPGSRCSRPGCNG